VFADLPKNLKELDDKLAQLPNSVELETKRLEIEKAKIDAKQLDEKATKLESRPSRNETQKTATEEARNDAKRAANKISELQIELAESVKKVADIETAKKELVAINAQPRPRDFDEMRKAISQTPKLLQMYLDEKDRGEVQFRGPMTELLDPNSPTSKLFDKNKSTITPDIEKAAQLQSDIESLTPELRAEKAARMSKKAQEGLQSSAEAVAVGQLQDIYKRAMTEGSGDIANQRINEFFNYFTGRLSSTDPLVAGPETMTALGMQISSLASGVDRNNPLGITYSSTPEADVRQINSFLEQMGAAATVMRDFVESSQNLSEAQRELARQRIENIYNAAESAAARAQAATVNP